MEMVKSGISSKRGTDEDKDRAQINTQGEHLAALN